MNIANYRTSIILAVTFTILLSTFWFYQDFAFILVLIALASIISRSFIPSFQRFVAELPTIGAGIQQMPIFADTDVVSHVLERLRSVGGELVRTSLTFLLAAFGKVLDFVIIIFVSFYLLKDGAEIRRWLADLFPHKSRGRVLRLFDTLLVALRAYICSQLVLCAITGLVVLAYFKLMGLPYASVFALLSGVGEFIPVLGPTVASTLGVVLSGELLGAAGMFLAVPLIVIVKIVITDIYRDRREMQRAGDGED